MSKNNEQELTEEQKKLINDNINFVTWFAGKKSKEQGLLSYDDLTSITYFALIKAASKYNPKKSGFKGFLGVVAKQSYLDALRDESRFRNHTDKFAADKEQPFAVDGDYTELWDAINFLGERDRKVIVDFYFVGLNYKEIAAKYDISPTGIGMIIKRAKEKIKISLS